MSKHPAIPNDAVLRVHVNVDGTVDILDFGLPPRSGRDRRGLKQEDVPVWIIEAISMLRITDSNDLVKGVGFKVSDTLYYIEDRQGDQDE